MTRPDLPLRIEVDRAAISAVGRLRLFAGIACICASTWIAVGGPKLLGWFIASLGWLAGLGWTVAFLRSRREARRPDLGALQIDETGLRWGAPPDLVVVPWGEVTKIEVNDERLRVDVWTSAPTPLPLEARYQGLGVHDLADLLNSCRPTPSQSENSH